MCELTRTAASPEPPRGGSSEPEPRSRSRRGFLTSGAAGLVAGAAASAGLSGCATAEPAAISGAPGQRVLLKGGVVLTMDAKLGDFDRADVLIEGSKIVAVGPNLQATSTVIDCSSMIVMPGFVDTHRHIWQGPLRNVFPDGRLGDYFKSIGTTARGAYRPEDVYVGDLLSSWGAMNAGITTLLDWSHISNTPAHSDAAVQGLRESGIRGVYAYGFGAPGPGNQILLAMQGGGCSVGQRSFTARVGTRSKLGSFVTNTVPAPSVRAEAAWSASGVLSPCSARIAVAKSTTSAVSSTTARLSAARKVSYRARISACRSRSGFARHSIHDSRETASPRFGSAARRPPRSDASRP